MMKKIVSTIFSLFVLVNINIYSQGLGDVDSLSVNSNMLILFAGNDKILFEACRSDILRVNYFPEGAESPNTPIIADSTWEFNGHFIDTTGNPVKVSTSDYTVEIEREPIRFSVYSPGNGILFSEQSEEGLNSNGIKLNALNKNYYGIDNRDKGKLTSNDGGFVNAGLQGDAGAPFVWTNSGFGMLVDSDGGSFDINSTQLNFYKGAGDKEDLELYFIFGDPKEIFTGLHKIIGNPPLFPKFSLGFMNTEWGMDEEELRSDIAKYRKKNIPIDAYILDFDWMAWGEDNYGEFRWGDKFPGGSTYQLKSDMDSLGLKMFGIRKPRIHVNTIQGEYCEQNDFFMGYETDYFSGQRVGLLDFSKEEVRDWYWHSFAIRNDAYNKGIIGYWNDEADQYGGNFNFLQMQQSMYEGQRELNDQRVWSINRNFYLGSQRYAYGIWSGDISTGFMSMANQRLFMLSSVNLGGGWWGMDIGGFHGTPSPENYYRWIQFGAFVPIFRVHGVLDEEREPWNYGEKAEEISKRYIRLRYSLMPYIYSAARNNHETGIPIVRPLVMDYPNDPNVVNLSSEWMFGEDMLVNPVVYPGLDEVEVYLPEGEWIDYFNGKHYFGPAHVTIKLQNDDIPVFIKAGSIIPVSPVGNYVDDPSTKSIIAFDVFTGGSDYTTLYEDDGKTFNYENGEFSKSYLYHESTQDFEYVNISNRTGSYQTPERDYLVKMRFVKDGIDSVLLNGENLYEKELNELLENAIKGWSYDIENEICYARTNDTGIEQSFKFYLKKDNEPPQIDSAYLNLNSEIVVHFNEPVLTNDSEHSAVNINNYSLSGGLSIEKITASNNKEEVTLEIGSVLTNDSYILTVRNIDDLSSQINLIPETQITIENSRPSSYVITLQNGIDGYEGTSDAHIAENFPNNNMGGNPEFEVCRYAGNYQGDDKSAIIKFDLEEMTGISDSIISANLILTSSGTRNGATPKKVSAYRVTKDWNEGNIAEGIDGAQAESGDVTWRSARHSIELWNEPGGDFDNEILDSNIIGDTPGIEYSWDITEAVRLWLLANEQNSGIILREENPLTANGTKVFYSSEFLQYSLRPKLEINFKNIPTDIVEEELEVPKYYSLDQNYPNPFNPATTITYSLPSADIVKLKIYNTLGELVETLVNKEQSAGVHTITWSAGNLSSGIYIYRLETSRFTDSKKLLLLK